MARYDDINTPAVVVVGFISAIVLFAAIVGVQTLYFRQQRMVIERQSLAAPAAADNLVAEQEARLRRRGWISREEGKVAVPIDRAMKLVVQELRQAQQEEANET